MKFVKIGMPFFMILLSCFFLIASLNIPRANLGNPNGPLYFPIGLSCLFLVFSIIYLVQEWKKLGEYDEKINKLLQGRVLKLVAGTLILGIIYAFIFDTLGFLVSTIVFLGGLLFLVNGHNKWLINIIVSIVFSLITWYGFGVLLGISLP